MSKTAIVITEIENRGGADFGFFYYSDGYRVGYRKLPDGSWYTFEGGKNWPEPSAVLYMLTREYLKTHGPVMLERTIEISNEGSRERPWGTLRISDGTKAEFYISPPGASEGVMLELKNQEGNEPLYIQGLVEELTEHLAAVDWSELPAAGATHPVDQGASV